MKRLAKNLKLTLSNFNNRLTASAVTAITITLLLASTSWAQVATLPELLEAEPPAIVEEASPALLTRAQAIRAELLKSDSDQVMVIAHRGDWRNAPENSLQAIINCISMGVDIVEIDVKKTSDGQLVVIHDKTLDRTTTGKGKVSSKTLAEIQKLYLRNGQGQVTRHRVPTLRQALEISKDEILINLDQCYDLFDLAYPIMDETGTVDQVIMKGTQPLAKVKRDLGPLLDEILFMPIILLHKPSANDLVDEYLESGAPVAFEFVFKDEKSPVLDRFEELRAKGSRVWVNSLWTRLSGGHDDDLAVTDIKGSYGWIVDKGTNMIQTDRPILLLDYLDHRGLKTDYKEATETDSTLAW